MTVVTLTTRQYIDKVKKVHGNRYDYSETAYTYSTKPVDIKCREHGVFSTRADVHLRGSNCPSCSKISISNNLRLSVAERNTLLLKHTPGFICIDERGLIVLRCTVHGLVKVKDKKSSHRHTCSICSKLAMVRRTTKTTEDFILEAQEVHGSSYNYAKVDYVRNASNVTITCPQHGDFEQTPNAHLHRRGCPGCCTHGYSRMAVEWIQAESKRLRLRNVRHALNGGEYIIPTTRFKVDGFHEASNTVFEFHGDAFHGNPNRYDPFSCPHPFNTKQAFRLYMETKARENKILSLGYKLVVMWESNYRRSIQ